MDDMEDDAKYPPNEYDGDDLQQQGYGSSDSEKRHDHKPSYSRQARNGYNAEDDDCEEDEEEESTEEEGNRKKANGVSYVKKQVDDEDDDHDDEDDNDDEDEDEEDEDGEELKGYNEENDDEADWNRHPKKRKLKSLVSSYEFAPRVPAPTTVSTSGAKPSSGGRNALTDWSERETFVLLDAWGERFLKRGRKSLRADEWQEVSEKVSENSKIERSDTQCRNRLDTLKKKFKKEKIIMADMGAITSKWVYFKKMDMLMSQKGGLSCGLDSGEYVFMNPRIYLNHANGLEEMRDSPANSESTDGAVDESDGLPPKKRKFGRQSDEGSSFGLLADSIHRFSEIYEKIEKSKRQQMLELEKMRMDFHRELEMQKRQIMERAQAEIIRLQQRDDENNDVSTGNISR